MYTLRKGGRDSQKHELGGIKAGGIIFFLKILDGAAQERLTFSPFDEVEVSAFLRDFQNLTGQRFLGERVANGEGARQDMKIEGDLEEGLPLFDAIEGRVRTIEFHKINVCAKRRKENEDT